MCYISFMDASCTDLLVNDGCSWSLTGPHKTKERPEKHMKYKFHKLAFVVKCRRLNDSS